MMGSYPLVDWNEKRKGHPLDAGRNERQKIIYDYLEHHYSPKIQEEPVHREVLRLVSFREMDLQDLLANSQVNVLNDTQRYLHLVADCDGYVARTAFVGRLEKDGLVEAVADYCASPPKKKTPHRPATALR